MSAEQEKTPGFDAALKHAISEGKAGRAEIVARLAGLSLEDLAKVPASAITLLGPGGLAALAAARGDLPAGLTPVGQEISTLEPRNAAPSPSGSPKNRTNVLAGVFVLLVLLSGPIFDAVRPLARQVMDAGWRPTNVSIWPRCTRLDAYVDGCLYRVGGNATTLVDIADRLQIPATRLMASNTHLRADTRSVLPRGADVVVWRGRLVLGGPRR